VRSRERFDARSSALIFIIVAIKIHLNAGGYSRTRGSTAGSTAVATGMDLDR
jgi:hypothetical protein